MPECRIQKIHSSDHGSGNDGCWEENKNGKHSSKTPHVNCTDDGDSADDSDHLYSCPDGTSDPGKPGTDQSDKPGDLLYGIYSWNKAFRSELCLISAPGNCRTSGILRIFRRCRQASRTDRRISHRFYLPCSDRRLLR